jgi:hypothetical protein
MLAWFLKRSLMVHDQEVTNDGMQLYQLGFRVLVFQHLETGAP